VSKVEKLTVSTDRPAPVPPVYTSVLVFWRARVISDDAEKAVLLNLLVEKYAGGKAFEPVEENMPRLRRGGVRVDEISGNMNVDPDSSFQRSS